MHYQPKEWLLQIGEREYSFTTFSKKDALSCQEGIYIFGYTHLRGHYAGYQLNVLGITAAADFQRALEGCQSANNLEQGNWNSVYFYPLKASSQEKSHLLESIRSLSFPLYSS